VQETGLFSAIESMTSFLVSVSGLRPPEQLVDARLVLSFAENLSPDDVREALFSVADMCLSGWVGIDFVVTTLDTDAPVFALSGPTADLLPLMGLLESLHVFGEHEILWH